MKQQKYGLNKREIVETLKSRGINPTTQRTEIAHFVLQKPQHLSAEEILNRLNKEYERVSQATVYNTLRLFVDRGVLRELIFSPDRIYYDSNVGAHHHFIDVDTGKIYDLPLDALPVPELNISGIDAEVMEVSLMIKGRLNEGSENTVVA